MGPRRRVGAFRDVAIRRDFAFHRGQSIQQASSQIVTGSFDSCLITVTGYVEMLTSRSALPESGPSRSQSQAQVF
jgi:hypothetical protein